MNVLKSYVLQSLLFDNEDNQFLVVEVIRADRGVTSKDESRGPGKLLVTELFHEQLPVVALKF